MPRSRWMHRTRRLAALLILATPLAHADSWRVDLLLFEDRYNPNGAAGEIAPPSEVLDAPEAIPLDDEERLTAAGIRVLPEDAPFGLQDRWNNLLNSQRFEPAWKISWVQADPPQFNAPQLLLRLGEPLELPREEPRYFGDFQAQSLEENRVWPIEGLLSLTLGRYLHLAADLSWNQPGEFGEVHRHRLKERRRMRSGELHHIDSPRFGLLVRIEAWKEPEPEPTEEPGPTPAPGR